MGCGTSQSPIGQPGSSQEDQHDKGPGQHSHYNEKTYDYQPYNHDRNGLSDEKDSLKTLEKDHKEYNQNNRSDEKGEKINKGNFYNYELDENRHEHREGHNKLKPQSPIYEDDDETPFDDDDIRDNVGYHRNSMGLMEKTKDFRHQFLDEEPDERPHGSPDNLFVDEEFSLELAIVQDNKDIEWKRPKAFVDNPKLFTDGSTRFDIGQGSAGTCWFLSIVSYIADNKHMMQQILPETAYHIEHPDKYDGVFHARFFRFGKWDDVYIDDFLPVIYGDTLWGAKSSTDNNELWVALLEKAFARIHGSYDAIYGGQPGDAYLQLTGGIGERIELEGLQDKASTVFGRIKNALLSNCQVTCVVPDEFDNCKGLVGGHAYSLVAATEVGKTKLLRVRNPWGHGEWKGAWSDGSSEWKTIPDDSIAFPNKDDGEFYVCLEDFMKYFSQTSICSLTPDFDMDGCSDSLNYVLNIYGEWYGETAAGFRNLLQNPRFFLILPKTGALEDGRIPLVIQIIQYSKKRQTDNISIRCDVFKVLGDKILNSGRCMALEIQGQNHNVYSPELQSSFRFKLKPGRYMIIPSAVSENQEKAFLLRLFSPGPLESVKEIPQTVHLTYCENEEMFEFQDQKLNLTFEKTLFGEFVRNLNAGGQVSNQATYYSNPQYLITIPDTGSSVPLVIHIMQENTEPQYPVGIRIFRIYEGQQLPLTANYLYENYNDCPSHLEGKQSKFEISWDVDVRYLLPPGKYVALVHLDEPDTEKSFSILFKSTESIKIKGFRTSHEINTIS